MTDDNSIEDSGGISKNIKDYSIDTDTSFEKKQKSADGQGNMPLYVFKKNDEWVVKNERFSGIEKGLKNIDIIEIEKAKNAIRKNYKLKKYAKYTGLAIIAFILAFVIISEILKSINRRTVDQSKIDKMIIKP